MGVCIYICFESGDEFGKAAFHPEITSLVAFLWTCTTPYQHQDPSVSLLDDATDVEDGVEVAVKVAAGEAAAGEVVSEALVGVLVEPRLFFFAGSSVDKDLWKWLPWK